MGKKIFLIFCLSIISSNVFAFAFTFGRLSKSEIYDCFTEHDDSRYHLENLMAVAKETLKVKQRNSVYQKMLDDLEQSKDCDDVSRIIIRYNAFMIYLNENKNDFSR